MIFDVGNVRQKYTQAAMISGSPMENVADFTEFTAGHDLLHADGIADGRLLDDRHELIGDGREDVLDGLRQHDGLQRLAARQAEAAGRPPDWPGSMLWIPGADNLAEVGSGVQRQRNDARQKALKANEAEQLERRPDSRRRTQCSR